MAGKALPPQDFEVTPLSAEDLHWRNGFDSRFLRFTALSGKPMVVTIAGIENLKSSRVVKGQLETKAQRLITLAEFEKKWATNITNCETIETLYGPDMHAWVGKRIELYPTKTRGPTGGMVDCIRVRDKVPAGQTRAPEPAAPAAAPPAPRPTLSDRALELLKLMGACTTLEELTDLEAESASERFPEAETKLLDKAFDKRRGQLTPE